ncbi:50S ribosomal protein L13 [Halobacteriales archaeon QH_10_67_13]|nr:MAG: 50S ribosomal protein L13 [Halobacteriales archaeon QH_10_67_13]
MSASFDPDVVIDARDCVVGRVASEVAERALAGERVAVVNAERAVITGREEQIKDKYKQRREHGSDRGPYYPKRPDRIFKRSVRGMVPYKRPRGREAFENVRAYVGNPYDEETELIEDASLDRRSTIKFVSLGEISDTLGANVTW